MTYIISFAEFLLAGQTLRDYPQMDEATFYSTMAAANPQGLTQEETETVIAQATAPLVQLEYTQTASFSDFAPWIRSLPDAQVDYHLEAIHKRYLTNMQPVILQDQIDTLTAKIEHEDTKLALVALEKVDSADEDLTEALEELEAHLTGKKDLYNLKKTELQKIKDSLS